MNRLIAILVGVVACGKTASDLAPFPCATDLTCPAGLGCVAGQCDTPQLDATCTTGDDPTNCSVAAAGAVCSAGSASGVTTGACEIPCSPACPTGRNCTDNAGGGVCLVDCTTTTCPAGSTCHQRSFDTRKLCVPPGIHCAQVLNPTRCTSSECEANSVGGDPCGSGLSCPIAATCNASTKCDCSPGLVGYDCTDTICNGQCGGSTHWWCAPDVTRVTCQTDLRGLSGTCKCWNGTMINVGCGQMGKTCEDLCAGR